MGNEIAEKTDAGINPKPVDIELQWEQILRNALSESLERARVEPNNINSYTTCLMTDIALRNFLLKYFELAKEPSLVQRVIRHMINYFDASDKQLMRCQSILVDELTPKLRDAGFGIKAVEDKPWQSKLIDALQVNASPTEELRYPNPKFEEFAKLHENIDLRMASYIDNHTILKNKKSQRILITGDVRQGKSTIALWKMLYFYEDKGETMTKDFKSGLLKNNIIYIKDPNLKNRIMYDEDTFIVLDESIWLTFSAKTMTKDNMEITEALTSSASRRNAYAMCMAVAKTQQKSIQRLTDTWYHIPITGTAMLYARGKVWPGDDPWGMDELNAAKYDNQINYLLTHMKTRITTMKIARLPEWFEAEYNKLKKEHQEAFAEQNADRAAEAERKEELIIYGKKLYRAGTKDIQTAFEQDHIPKKLAKKWADQVYEEIAREDYLNKLKSEKNDQSI